MSPSDAEGAAVWVTCAELARRRGVSRPAITKRVDQLETDGKVVTRREGRSRLVDLAAFDRAVGETGDAVKELAAATSKEATAKPPAMRDAQTERAQYEARLKALDLAERQRSILPIAGDHGIEQAAKDIGAALAREIDGIVHIADDIAVAVSREGVLGARRVLKEAATRIRQSTAQALSTIASQGQAAERDGPIETLLPDE